MVLAKSVRNCLSNHSSEAELEERRRVDVAECAVQRRAEHKGIAETLALVSGKIVVALPAHVGELSPGLLVLAVQL
eukprot:5595153-Pleurochrysis_carterae.AAC.1